MENKSIEDLAPIEAIYLFLARMFLEEIDAGLLNHLRSEDVAKSLENVGVALPDTGQTDEEFLDAAAEEYAALFIAPGSSPPYQSVAEEGRYLAGAADKVELFYQDCGFEYRKEYPEVFPDHLGLQLHFIASLLEGEINAMRENNSELAEQFNSKRIKFFKKHLGEWYAPYFDKLSQGVKHPLYASVIEFAHAFLDSEADSMAMLPVS